MCSSTTVYHICPEINRNQENTHDIEHTNTYTESYKYSIHNYTCRQRYAVSSLVPCSWLEDLKAGNMVENICLPEFKQIILFGKNAHTKLHVMVHYNYQRHASA